MSTQGGPRRSPQADLASEAARRQADERAADRAAEGALRSGATGPPGERDVVRELGARMGHDFSRVDLHDDAAAAALTGRLGAAAVTVGHDVYFAPGRRETRSTKGRALLAHELAHVGQQATTGPRIQAKFVATGSAQDFVDLVNRVVTVQHRVQVSASGEISVVATDVQGPPTRDQSALLERIRSMIADRATTTIDFMHGDTSTRTDDDAVIVGSYALSRIDLDDVAAFGFEGSEARAGDNAVTELVHELTEQQRKQVHGEGFATAHRAAYAEQERQLGATMTGERVARRRGGLTVTTSYRYPDGRTVDVIWDVDSATHRVSDVRRVIRPPGPAAPPGGGRP
ncbi:DUF4157 domain-containing protein [Isoptericola jiangsuensis]|uniref:eCIS core domain-containing protein n=1 Tax=Isoptericola jiangsuensis TaxID=548579 RepID=UPI003AAAE76B